MRLVDCRRAAHFAHFNAEDEEDTNDGDNVHVGGEEVRSTYVHSIAYRSENVVLGMLTRGHDRTGSPAIEPVI
jgi:hypothetical protein